MDTRIISLIGRQGAGKSTIGRTLSKYLGVYRIETSDVVKAVFPEAKGRAALAATGEHTKEDPYWLGKAMEAAINEMPVAILTGVRETEVHDYLTNQGAVIHVVHLYCEPHIRYQRLLSLDKVQSAGEFLEHELREDRLGIRKVMGQAKYRIPVTDEVTPENTAENIRRALGG